VTHLKGGRPEAQSATGPVIPLRHWQESLYRSKAAQRLLSCVLGKLDLLDLLELSAEYQPSLSHLYSPEA